MMKTNTIMSKIGTYAGRAAAFAVGFAAFLVLCADIADDSPLVDAFGGWIAAVAITKIGALAVLCALAIIFGGTRFNRNGND